VPLGSALALSALAAAALLTRARESWEHVLIDRPGAGAVFARLMPASFVLPFGGGLLVLSGVRAGFYSPTFGISIFAVLMIATLIALSWETAFVAARVEGALQHSNAGLLAARLRAEEATRAKTRFLAGMSHELRTPLHAILGYAELLAAESGLSAAQRKRIVSMLGTGRHLLETINSVLTVSEIESGRLELRPASIDLKLLAADCIDLVRPNAEAKGLAVTVETAPDLPAAIVADATRLRQILVNLLGNAVKFTDRGRVVLRLRRAPPEGRLSGVSIEIADTGPGIPTDRRPALFQEFERLDRDRDSRIEGAGLGLAIAARLTALMHGSIGYAENPGGGSIFRLLLPGTPPDAPGNSGPLPPDLARLATDTRPAFTLRRVLIVDDVEMNREIAAAFLRTAGHAVITAATGEAAVTEAARQKFDVVLMDVRMGEMDGFEATRRIRALGGTCRQLPIIAMTAHVFADQIEACARAGMDFHLAKPFGQAALLAAIETALDWRNTGRGQETGPAPTAGNGLPVIDTPRFDTIAAYFSASSMVTYLQRLAAGIEVLTIVLPTLDPAAAVSAETADAVHALAGKAGMLGFGRLALSASQFEQLARSDDHALAIPIASLLIDLQEALAETLARLADLGVQSA